MLYPEFLIFLVAAVYFAHPEPCLPVFVLNLVLGAYPELVSLQPIFIAHTAIHSGTLFTSQTVTQTDTPLRVFICVPPLSIPASHILLFLIQPISRPHENDTLAIVYNVVAPSLTVPSNMPRLDFIAKLFNNRNNSCQRIFPIKFARQHVAVLS